jgi:hypothetical protein
MINRDSWGRSYRVVRGEILGLTQDGQLRQHSARMFSLIKNESWGIKVFGPRQSTGNGRLVPGSQGQHPKIAGKPLTLDLPRSAGNWDAADGVVAIGR